MLDDPLSFYAEQLGYQSPVALSYFIRLQEEAVRQGAALGKARTAAYLSQLWLAETEGQAALTGEQAARILHQSQFTLSREISRGALRAKMIAPPRMRRSPAWWSIDREEFIAYYEKLQAARRGRSAAAIKRRRARLLVHVRQKYGDDVAIALEARIAAEGEGGR